VERSVHASAEFIDKMPGQHRNIFSGIFRLLSNPVKNGMATVQNAVQKSLQFLPESCNFITVNRLRVVEAAGVVLHPFPRNGCRIYCDLAMDRRTGGGLCPFEEIVVIT
jgi:hypothetical protein